MRTLRTLLLAVVVLAAHSGWAADISTISHGQEVQLTDHLAPGRYTLFDFYADWCGPCRVIGPRVERLAADHPDRLALRKVDIVNWDTPVARQYRLRSIPHLKLLDPEGRVVAEGDAGRVLAAVDRVVAGDAVVGRASRTDRGWSPWPLVGIGVLVAAVVLLLIPKKGRSLPTGTPPPQPQPRPAEAADPDDPAVWFVMLGESLDGPYNRADLADMCGRGIVPATAHVRRRGESRWTPVEELLGR
jgi:thioredoxin 1